MEQKDDQQTCYYLYTCKTGWPMLYSFYQGRVHGQNLAYVVVYTKKTTILCTLLFQENLHGKSLIKAPLKHL